MLAEALVAMVRLIEPFAPHMGAELWEMMGRERIWDQPWPLADPQFLVHDTVELAVQVNGKVRGRITVDADADKATVEAAALADEKVLAFLAGATPKKLIVVPGRLVNLVV